MEITNPCSSKTDKCINCHNHFYESRPLIKKVIITHHFKKDFTDYEDIVKDILDCSHTNFIELHKFEEHIDRNLIFRAKKDRLHFVYAIDKEKRLIFLRAFHNFKEYEKFLSNKKEIGNMIELA